MKRMGKLCIAIVAGLSASVAAHAGQQWRIPGDFGTIQQAIDSPNVIDGDTLRLAPGDYAGVLLTKSVEIQGEGGARIVSGPAHPSGLIQGFRLMAGSGGSTFSHLTFAVDLAIMNGAAIDDVTVTQCTFLNSLQAVSNWGGSGWQITQNDIIDLRTQNGGGIGILIAEYTGGTVMDNVVSHNKISGVLHLDANELGGYSGTGIVIYADFRWTRSGAEEIAYNRVVKNKVDLISENPALVDVYAFELTDTRGISLSDPVIHDNTIGFNDWSNMGNNQIALTPSDLDLDNPISRNLGDNRGHGLHPGIFGPN